MTQRLLLLSAFLFAAAGHATPSGKKWQSDAPVPYRIFSHSAITCGTTPCDFINSVIPAVNAGFARWTSAQVSCTSWSTSYQGTFTLPSGATTAAVGNDALNRILWLGGDQWLHGAQTYALTTTIYYTNTGQIIDADMELNNDVTWKLGGTTAFQVDVESIVTHEAGHFLGLDHSAPTQAVMYAFYNGQTGELKRNLTAADIQDVCTVYPAGVAPGSRGDACTSDADCNVSTPDCRGASGAAARICTTECTTDSQCPAGYACLASMPGGSSGKACLPASGAPDLCDFCTSGSECSTGQCVTNGTRNWCTRTCLVDTDCGAGFTCVDGTTSKVCAPNNGACPQAQCSTDGACAVGYVCQGGMCTATGNPGDRCETSLYCDPCSVCIGTTSEAYCRPCCGGAGGTGACKGCSIAACASGSQCFTVTGTTDEICHPTAGGGTCAACDATTPCQSGECVAGRCHAACSPSSPGTCNACFDTGGGSGVCACPGEVGHAGAACGQLATGIVACIQGTVCVGAPKTCRTSCDLALASSCPSGEVCQSVEGQPVCVPAQIPGERCSPCTAGGGCANGFSCVGGRCYAPCNPDQPTTCSGCIEASPGVGVCACDDQRSQPGQGCGNIAGVLYGCIQGASCVNGTCRLQCNPTAPSCPVGENCFAVAASGFCAPPGTNFDTGTPDGGAVVVPGPGTPTKPPTSGGCGCRSTDGAPISALLLGALLALSRRRPRHRASERP